MTDAVRIPRRFRGPPDSGNGGYVCGRLAAFVDAPSVVVRLRVPPPLERELTVRAGDDPGSVRLVDGESVVAEARPGGATVDPPEPVSFAEAEHAARGYRGFEMHWFPTCFVCGPERDAGDGLRLFPGPVEGRDVVACPWVPDASLAAAGSELIAPEFLWAALDCPGAFSFEAPAEGAVLLGELGVRIEGEVAVGERCVLVGWELAHQGRKHRTATALFGADGTCRGVGVGIWFEVPALP